MGQPQSTQRSVKIAAYDGRDIGSDCHPIDALAFRRHALGVHNYAEYLPAACTRQDMGVAGNWLAVWVGSVLEFCTGS